MNVVVDGLKQGYGRSVVIEGLNLSLRSGITALLGPNGAGKTTLLRTLATVLPPLDGNVIIGGITVNSEHAARSVRDEVGYLPQDFGFDPQMTVADFVEYAAWIRGVPAKRRSASVEQTLERVDLRDRSRTKMRKLSGGMQRRAGIAWAIVGEPRLVLLDEPTVGLDPRQRLQFRKIITELTDAVVVLSTHLIDDVEAICDQVVVMHGGAVKFDGTIADLTALSRDDLPGHSPLERAYMHLLPVEEQLL